MTEHFLVAAFLFAIPLQSSAAYGSAEKQWMIPLWSMCHKQLPGLGRHGMRVRYSENLLVIILEEYLSQEDQERAARPVKVHGQP
jgi:hypothetical protein